MSLSAARIARSLEQALLPRVEGPIPELGPREPEQRRLPETRDELRNGWCTTLLEHLFETAEVPRTSREFFSGKPLLPLTRQDGGEPLFRHIPLDSFRAGSAALYRPGGWLLLWSQQYGTGKSTLAYWHTLRHLRLLAEERADKETAYWGREGSAQKMPHVVFGWLRGYLAELKAQMGRREHRFETAETRMRKADWLVLDSVVPMTTWEFGCFDHVMGHRYDAMGRTILCVSACASEQALWDIVGPRVMDIVAERGATVQVDLRNGVGDLTGGSFRKQDRVESYATEIPA